jgi:hypothetical protein
MIGDHRASQRAMYADHVRLTRRLVSGKRGDCVGTWDHGPFDNDTAADWCGDSPCSPFGFPAIEAHPAVTPNG